MHRTVCCWMNLSIINFSTTQHTENINKICGILRVKYRKRECDRVKMFPRPIKINFYGQVIICKQNQKERRRKKLIITFKWKTFNRTICFDFFWTFRYKTSALEIKTPCYNNLQALAPFPPKKNTWHPKLNPNR